MKQITQYGNRILTTNYSSLLLLVILVNMTGLFGRILEPDGALYAYIAKQMAQHNDFINLYNNTDWLDKPHFPFWITAVSFKVFGITSFAYKLPAFLFWLLGIAYLYRLGKALYNRQTAVVAMFIYTTAFQAVLALFDVRAEPYLTALLLGATYHLYRLYVSRKLLHLVLAAFFSACAIMTKGPFFLITIVSGLGITILVKKEWREFVNYRWYLYLLLTFLFVTPELYCLYVQFDLHPEKVVYGKTGVSGLKFFFWDSQFGRFLNTGPIKGKGDLLFFFHTMLWAFLPWSILFYTSVVSLIQKKMALKPEQWIVVGSAAVTFLIFSLSKFQLPHYLIILFPHFALLCAGYLVSRQNRKGIRTFVVVQRVLLLVLLLCIASVAVVFGLPYYPVILFLAALLAGVFFYTSRTPNLQSVIRLGVGFCVILHLFLNLSFYPALLQYQAGTKAAQWFNQAIQSPVLGLYKTENFSVKFYTNSRTIATDTLPAPNDDKGSVNYFFTTQQNADSLLRKGAPVQVLRRFPNYHISKLKLSFLNKKSRTSQLDTMVIFRLTRTH